MKKLMVAAAIVCAAVMAQAAQIKWSTANVKDITGSANYSGAATLYVINSLGTVETFNGNMVDGKINDGSNNFLLVGDGSGADAGFIKQGQIYSAYYVMTDKDGNVFTSTTKSNITAQFPGTANAAFLNAGSWAAAPVPEPTSGLLLLLGVAGMALRRRRA